MSMIKSFMDVYVSSGPVDLTNARIVCDGNSLVFGQGAGSNESYPSQMKALEPFNTNGAIIYNFGVPGQTTTQMIADAATQIDPLRDPNVFSVVPAWEWLNAVAIDNKTVEQHCADIMTYRNGRIAAGYNRVGVLTNIAYNPDIASIPNGDSPEVFFQKLAGIKAWLLSGSQIPLPDVIQVHLRPELQDPYDTTYYTSDKVHLNATGYGVVAEVVRDWLVNLTA